MTKDVAVPAEPDDTPSNDVIPFTGDSAIDTRKAATTARTELARQQLELTRRQDEMKADLARRKAELEADFARQRAELDAMMAPLKEQLERLVEVMWSVDLYLGRDETLRLIRDGAPAPADTPIHLRQRVLVMAEESLVLMGTKNTGMDGDDVPHFVNWLIEDDAHLNQVIPEAKGVVVLVPTKVEARTGNVFEDMYKDGVNQLSYWVIRNGERVYLLTVDPEMKIFERVLPRRSEFVEVFDRHLFGFGRRDGEPVIPGSDEWLKMEKSADAKRRHYMRVLLVLQGILDRTPAWQPLPEGGASFLRLEDQDEGKIVLIQDGDDSLQLTDGHESFRDYQKRLNALLRPGMRVIGAWNSRSFAELRDKDYNDRYAHPRLTPDTITSLPDSTVPHLIEERRDGGFVIRFKRTDKVLKWNVPVPDQPGYIYRGLTDVEPTKRASLLVMPSDSWVLPFDLVTVAELEYFLGSRENRSKFFLSMIPTIRAAIEAKRFEAEAEAPFRDLIARLLMAEGAGHDAAPALVDELVHWWKVANTWARPLNGEPKHEAKAATQIVAEYKLRAAHAADDSIERMVAAGQAVPGAVAVARDRQGKWRVYAAKADAHDPKVFLDITPIRKDGTLGATEVDRVLQKRTATALFVAWQAEDWKTWNFGVNPNHYLTETERAQIVTNLRDNAEGTPICVTEFFDPTKPAKRTLAVYSWKNGHPSASTALSPSGLSSSGWQGFSSDTPVAVQVIRVHKDATGVTIEASTPRATQHSEAFSSYHPQYGSTFTTSFGRTADTGLPYYPDDAYQYPDARPRATWIDEGMLAEVRNYAERCEALRATHNAEANKTRATARRYATATAALITARQEAAARVRFEGDFGTDADDLWPAHLKSLDLKYPLDQTVVDDLIVFALFSDIPFVGQTLQQLADARTAMQKDETDWRRKASVPDLGEYGDIVIPEIETDAVQED